MPRSSDSVAALACALAKAQAELVNPEKSLTATIRTGRAGEGERSFRYAPLASGLDIVRKALGQHEIATLQTTAIDQSVGIVNLTTMLAHASGEWIASEWPVCPIADMASPQRMGAALTYARRYALFTLVGIAGEDDLDAPDLADKDPTSSPGIGTNGGARGAEPQKSGNGDAARMQIKETAVMLDPGQSAAVRDRLLGEVASLASNEAAATWARGVLGAKNSLTATDAKRVEEAFEQKLYEIAGTDANQQPSPTRSEPAPAALEQSGAPGEVAASATYMVATQVPAPARGRDRQDTAEDHRPKRIDKSVLPVSAPRRYRSKDHLRDVARQACLVCGRKPCDPHHLRFTQPRALGRKVSDEFTVPLCRTHHRAVHRTGDEAAWWQAAGIDPIKVARTLWSKTRLGGQDLGVQDPGEGALVRSPTVTQPKDRPFAPQAISSARSESDRDDAVPAGHGRTP
jgi:ERF superfamily